MRKLCLLLAGIGALGLVAGTATAGTLVQADLALSLNHATVTFSRTAATGVAGSSTAASATMAAGSTFAGLAVTGTPLTQTGPGMTRATIVLGANGKVGAAPSGVSVTAPISGNARFRNAYGTLITVPLAIGAGTPGNPHVFTVAVPINFVGTAFVSVAGTGWHVGAVTATALTYFTSPLPDVSAHGSFALNAQGGGTVTLVTLSRITVSGIYTERTAEPTYLTLTYLPEPRSLLLLGAAAYGVVAAGWRRRSET